MTNKISERIKKGLEIRNMKQSELVEKTGIGKSSISTYLSGDYEPKQRNIYKIAKALDVNEAWLMGLDVPMEKHNYIKVVEELLPTKLSQEETILLENFNKLNNLGKEEANKRVAELTLIPTYTEIKNNVTELITATTKKEPQTLKDLDITTLAAHDDNLTEEEKVEMDKRILEALKKRQK